MNLLGLLLILLLGSGISLAARRARFPSAVALVVLGILLGPSVLNWVGPSVALTTLGELSVVLLLGLTGLELGLRNLTEAGWAGFWVAVVGMLLSWVGGYTVAWLWGSPYPEAIYVGTAFTATSIGIGVQVLKQFNLIESRIGQVIVAAAIIDDVIALYLIAVTHGLLSQELMPARVAGSVLLAILLLAAIFVICRSLARIIRSRFPELQIGYRLTLTILLIIASAGLTHWADLSPIVGAFFAGLGVGEGFGDSWRAQNIHHLGPVVLMLVPFFFVLIGVQAEWSVLMDPGMKGLLIGLVVVAMGGKVIGSLLGTASLGDWTSRFLVGIGMAARGEVALVIANLGYEQGHISHHMLVALILTSIVAALLAPLLMMPLARRLATSS